VSEDVPPSIDPAVAGAQAIVAAALDTRQQSSALAIAVLADMATKISSKFDAFATWLLAGFGGAIALMLTSHDAIALISRNAIRTDLKLFGAAVVITVIEKYIAIVVIAGAEASLSARAMVLEHFKMRREINQPPNLDARIFAAEILRAIFRPFRSLAERSAKKIDSGDTGAGMRRLVRLSQVQGLLLLVQIVLFLIALGTIIRALPP
jgi:hypothetical protein